MKNETSRPLVIAIDGPAGSGKSTVSKRVAKELGLLYVDTGAMYRALTLKAVRMKLDLEDEAVLTGLARTTEIDLEDTSDLKVFLDGEDVAGLIRTPEITNNIKYIARVPGVRKEMVKKQRAIGSHKPCVLEGRDIGTVVFPDADYKFYLDANIDVRAKRRFKDLAELGQGIPDIDDVRRDVILRDESDIKRAVGALKKAADAVRIDTTNRSIEEVAAKILSYIK
ncbi:MAG: cytidylate kinase [Omnitrophica bacterium RIFCSPLOWO2_01_FULL_45_10]|nr:MAG: cytidylate kinase [Omnitrophica bacterium RIFCSPLOWO2_01_FULL_45_10]